MEIYGQTNEIVVREMTENKEVDKTEYGKIKKLYRFRRHRSRVIRASEYA